MHGVLFAKFCNVMRVNEEGKVEDVKAEKKSETPLPHTTSRSTDPGYDRASDKCR